MNQDSRADLETAIRDAFSGIRLRGGISLRQASVIDRRGLGMTDAAFQGCPPRRSRTTERALSAGLDKSPTWYNVHTVNNERSSMASHRLCGDPADYVSLPDEENSREGWISHHAVCGPRETPGFGDRLSVDEKDYTVEHWTEVRLDQAPEACTKGLQPGQGIFDLRLQPV